MREFKFRVWDKTDKRLIVHEQEFIPLKVTSVGVLRLDPCSKEEKWILIPKEKFEIMQYTGLKDCNGIEIYEGDLVKAGVHIGVIEYKENEGMFIVNTPDWDLTFEEAKNIKVIGNIYQNKELLDG